MISDFAYFTYLIMTAMFFALAYHYLDPKYFKLRACLLFSCLDYFFTLLNVIFDVEDSLYYNIQAIILLSVLFLKIFSYIKPDEINNDNVCLIFYRPKKLKQFILSMIGMTYSSAGLVINKKIYQMRYEAETLQEIPFKDNTEEYLKEKYLIIDTRFKWKDLKGDWRENLLSQHARQKSTLYFRLNCLRSLRFVLNQIPQYRYSSFIFLPCLYLIKIRVLKIYNKLKNLISRLKNKILKGGDS